MKKSLLIAVPLLSTIMFSGCSTILSGTTQQISVNSNPTNIEIELGNTKVITPSIVTVKRGDDLIIKSSKCSEQKILAKKINPVFFVNILSGGVFGSTTDYSTGAMWKYDENINLNCNNY